MGCFNHTCMLSGLPIRYEDEIVLYILEGRSYWKESVGGGYCYTTDLWAPLMWPLYGKYNDYGRIEEVQGDNTVLLDFFIRLVKGDNRFVTKANLLPDRMMQSEWVPVEGGKGQTLQKKNPMPESPMPEDIEDLISMLQDGRLSLDCMRRSSDVSFVMMHKSIHDAVIGEMSRRVPYGQEQPVGQLWRRDIESIVAEHKAIEPLGDQREGESKEDYCKRMTAIFRAEDRLRNGLFNHNLGMLSSALYHHIAGSFSTSDIADMITRWRLISGAVDGLNRMWAPMMQSGQDVEYALPRLVAAEADKIIAAQMSDTDGEEEGCAWDGTATIYYHNPMSE